MSFHLFLFNSFIYFILRLTCSLVSLTVCCSSGWVRQQRREKKMEIMLMIAQENLLLSLVSLDKQRKKMFSSGFTFKRIIPLQVSFYCVSGSRWTHSGGKRLVLIREFALNLILIWRKSRLSLGLIQAHSSEHFFLLSQANNIMMMMKRGASLDHF